MSGDSLSQGDQMGHYGMVPQGQPMLMGGGQTMRPDQPYGQRGTQYGVGGAPSGLSGMAAQANAPSGSGLARFGANVNAQQPAPYQPRHYAPQDYARATLANPGGSGSSTSGEGAPVISGASEGVGTQGDSHGLGAASASQAGAALGTIGGIAFGPLGAVAGNQLGGYLGSVAQANDPTNPASVNAVNGMDSQSDAAMGGYGSFGGFGEASGGLGGLGTGGVSGFGVGADGMSVGDGVSAGGGGGSK